MTEYDEQAREFVQKTKTTIEINYLEYKAYFLDDSRSRNIYTVTLRNSNGAYSYTFGDSLENSSRIKNPSNYSVLACLSTYNDGTSFAEFCENYGYDVSPETTQSEKNQVIRIWKQVCKESRELRHMYSDRECEELDSIV